jgi:hypothetical protein
VLRPSSPRTSHRVELPNEKMNELQLTQALPNCMIQRVRTVRSNRSGSKSFSMPRMKIGANQTIVLTVQAVKVSKPRSWRIVFLGTERFPGRFVACILL